MAKLQTPGLITKEEYEKAQTEDRFLITENVVCSYCQEPVSYRETYDLYQHKTKRGFDCKRHRELILSMVAYPGYPSIPKDEPRYGQMHIFLSEVNRTLYSDERIGYVAEDRGCPFCNRYLSIQGTDERDTSLLSNPLFCEDCEVAFLIEVIERQENGKKRLELRFQPEPEVSRF